MKILKHRNDVYSKGEVCSPRNFEEYQVLHGQTKNLPVESKMQLGSPDAYISASFINKQHL